LRELLGAEELRELLDPGVLADVELELQCLADGRRARSADELHDVLRKVGDLSAAEIDVRCEGSGVDWLTALVDERRAIEIGIGDDVRFAAAEDAARYRDALGCSIPLGLPMAFTDPVPRPLEELVSRFARTHGPFHAGDAARRFSAPVERIGGAISALAAEERLVLGEFRPDGVQREWCDVNVLRQLRRRSLAVLRKEVEPVEQDAFARFLPQWHSIPAERRGLEALVDSIGMLAGAPIVASTLDRDVLPSRLIGYRPAALDELCTSGEVVWTGAGAIGARDGRIRLCFADQIGLLAPGWETGDGADGEVHVALRRLLSERGASFWGAFREAAPDATDTELLVALWDLVWAGEVTNDTLAPLRALLAGGGVTGAKRPSRRSGGRPRPGRLSRLGPPAGAGRWSLVRPLVEPVPTATEAAHAQALQLLERHGVITREAVLAEGVQGGYASVYGVLKVLEERGRTRRGYFVAGLGAAQFALPGAVERLRGTREAVDVELDADRAPAPIVLAATDPAQPYGAALAWPDTSGRPARSANALVVLRQGTPLVWFERRSHHLVMFPGGEADPAWADALAALVSTGRERSVEVRKVDGGAVGDEVASALRAAGFVDGYRGLVIRS
ncbi:Lhr family helicase, partial [Ilumatobacter sp.]|uniref:Lhr family helicase n=1 Tax=Ilumatobacter sp. TaxID=1967498 RepID=UPI003AF98657